MTHGYTFHKTYNWLFSTRQRRINLLWSPDGIEFDYLRESQSAEQKTTNQNCHCHGDTRFLQPENKVLILAVDLPLFYEDSCVWKIILTDNQNRPCKSQRSEIIIRIIQ